jgi:hypothetical protein
VSDSSKLNMTPSLDIACPVTFTDIGPAGSESW